MYLMLFAGGALFVLFILWRKRSAPPDRENAGKGLLELKPLIRRLNTLYTTWETLVIRRELSRSGSGNLTWETDGGKSVKIPSGVHSSRILDLFDDLIEDAETEIIDLIPYIWKWYISFTGKDEIPLDEWEPPQEVPETGFIFAWRQSGNREWVIERFDTRMEAFSRKTAVSTEMKNILSVTDIVEMAESDFRKRLESKKIPVYTVEG